MPPPGSWLIIITASWSTLLLMSDSSSESIDRELLRERWGVTGADAPEGTGEGVTAMRYR